MKSSKFKNLIFVFVILISALSLCFIPFTNNKLQNTSAVTYTFTHTPTTVDDITGGVTEEDTGSIPFSLYTKDSSTSSVVEYNSLYTATEQTTSTTAKTIYYYTINEDSIPYIMLNSHKYDTMPDDMSLEEFETINALYDQTIVFKFNDQELIKKFNSDSVIPKESGFMGIEATVNGTPISIDTIRSTSTDNSFVVFELNLLPLSEDTANCKCPLLQEELETYLGGNGKYNDVSYRTGLYEFKIRYSFKNEMLGVSNECIFETAFYVLDYYSYISEADPLSFTNTNTFEYKKSGESQLTPSNYEIFNYNYTSAPTVEIDATKFAPNFLYTTGYLNYNFKYDHFNNFYTKDRIANLPYGTKTGEVVLKLNDSNLTYKIPTYKALPDESSITSSEEELFEDFSIYLSDDYYLVRTTFDKLGNKYLIWLDKDKNGVFNAGDAYYLSTKEESKGYEAGTDYLWLDNNNNGILDAEDVFFKDVDEDFAYDTEEDTIENSYNDGAEVKNLIVEKIQVSYLPYYAKFELQDFETNFLVPNNINTTFLGTYSFDLSFLIENSFGGYTVLQNEYIDNVPDSINNKKLLAFGYNLKYYDQDPKSSTYHENVELKNDATWANFIAYNNASTENETLMDFNKKGNLKNIPGAIAITNQAPLRFDSFGNLVNSFTAPSCSLDYKKYTEEEVLNYFVVSDISSIDNNLVTATGDNLLNVPYYQNSAITSDGIKIFKLEYQVNVTIDDKNQTITGCQYFCFEINNTVQSLYIQAIDYDNTNSKNVITSYDFDKYTNKNVRVNIEHKPNTFFAPVTVTYYYSRSYDVANYERSGVLNLKTITAIEDGLQVTKNYKYVIDGKNYYYFITENSNKFTFKDPGEYKIVIKNSISNVPVTYYFTIDTDDIAGIEVRNASIPSGNNYAIGEILKSSPLVNSNKFNKNDLYITNEAFTLGWNKKDSGAKTYSYYYFMEMQSTNDLEDNLFEYENESTNKIELWLTNGYKLSDPSSKIGTYKNYKDVSTYPNYSIYYEENYLSKDSYFNKNGLYIFYVFDQAGNFFTRTVLIDNTLGKVLQGYWDEDKWVNTFDPISNNQNYVDKDTLLYFGSHKAIVLPQITTCKETLDDISFIRAYNLLEEGALIENKPQIEFDLYEDILNLFTSYIKNSNENAIIKNSDYKDTNLNLEVGEKNYFLTIENESTNYIFNYDVKDENGAVVEDVTGTPMESTKTGFVREVSFVKIYKKKITAQSDLNNDLVKYTSNTTFTTNYDIAKQYEFYDEARYTFKIKNKNGLVFSKNIEMNFDVIKGTFYAFNLSEGPDNQHIIRKNTGTNLDVLRFTYTKAEGEKAKYYELDSLYFDYYEFLLDESNKTAFNSNYYPFSVTSTRYYLNEKETVNEINLNSASITQPGKYIIVREYVGGDYNLDPISGEFVPAENGKGGDYYKNKDGEFINLFEDDYKIRKYTVYVDHNGIVTVEYMNRDDEKPYVRRVGDNISVTLSNNLDDAWSFKEFFLTSTSTLNLETNKVPVKINIPLSKYFVSYPNIYAKQSFAQLSIVIYYQKSSYSVWQKYTIDGVDSKGYATSSDMKNANGQLIFSAAGNYRITISDRTGYLDNNSNREDADNINPTKFFGDYGYSFTISHTAPTAISQQKTYNYTKNDFNKEETLTNEYDDKTFATNIKEENYIKVEIDENDFYKEMGVSDVEFNENIDEKYFVYDEINKVFELAPSEYSDTKTYYVSNNYYIYENNSYILSKEYSSTQQYFTKINNNELFLTWSDPLTPYTAKIKQINVTVSYYDEIKDQIVNKRIKIDLNKKDASNKLIYDFEELLNDSQKSYAFNNFENFEFIKSFEVSFYNGISSASIYDHTDYYRYSYKLSLDIKKEYSYKIELSYISESNSNQSYKDENGVSYANSNYIVYIDRTKPNTNIDSLLNLESYLISSKYYSDITDIKNNFKEENFKTSPITLETIPSIFTYSFAVPNDYKLTYNESETMPYFFVRPYNKYNLSTTDSSSNNSSITPDMVDTVYNQDKAYHSENYSIIPPSYPRFNEIANLNVISQGNDIWYKVNYQKNVNLKSLIASAISGNTNPTGFYEIIERDLAGNYRCYTIYFNEFANKIYLNLNVDGSTEKNNMISYFNSEENTNSDNISASVVINLTDISSRLGWGTLTIKNETLNQQFATIKLTPFDENYSELLQNINQFLNPSVDSRFSLKLDTYNNNYKQVQLTRYINFDIDGNVKLEKPLVTKTTSGETTYTIHLPTYKSNTGSILYLEEVRISKITITQNGIMEQDKYSESERDKIEPSYSINEEDKGIYRVIFKDNFNDNSYYYILHIGEEEINDFNKEYSFEFSNYQKAYDPKAQYDVYYSGGKVNITYEANIYNVYINNALYSGVGEEQIANETNNFKSFTLSPSEIYKNIPASQPAGVSEYEEYIIEYKDIIDNSEGKTKTIIRIYNLLPEIEITNSNGTKKIATLEEDDTKAIASIVNLNWGYISYNAPQFTYTSIDQFNELQDSTLKEEIKANDVITAQLYKRNETTKRYSVGVTISRGQVITEEGYYKLVIKNSLLNNFREIYFTILFEEAPLYSVYEINTKTNTNIKLDYSTFEILNFNNEDNNNFKVENDNGVIDTIKNTIVNEIKTNENISIKKEDQETLEKHFTQNGISNVSNVPHYYSIYTPKIVYNSNIDLTIMEFTFKNEKLIYSELVTQFDETTGLSKNNKLLALNGTESDYYTTIFLIYNLNSSIRISFVAFTKVPTTSLVLGNTLTYSDKITDVINLNSNQASTSFTLTNTQVENSDVTLSWNAIPVGTNANAITWYNQGNVVIVSDQYGYNRYTKKLTCEKSGNQMSAIIAGSGTHKLTFKDFAGNIHWFANGTYYSQDSYTLNIIDTVIYHINVNDIDLNPIKNAVFNDDVNIIIDQEFIQYYLNSIVNTNVVRNGINYSSTNYISSDNNYLLTFTQPGKYVVTLSASYNSQNGATVKQLNTATYSFSIINKDSVRLAYEFVETSGYEFIEVLRDNEDISENFMDDNGKILSLFISATDTTKSGNGRYTVKLKYGDADEEVLTYSFRINNYIPTISSNVKHGETTTSNIVISYNPSVIYEQLGECYIKVLTYNNDSKTFNSNPSVVTINANSYSTSNSRSFEITRSNSYFIQVETKNGNILTSFRVNKKDPLNTIAIIIIVIAVIAVIVLVIVIIKLRTRMRIK